MFKINKAKNLKEVAVSSNYPTDMFKEFEEIQEKSGFELSRLQENSEDLGTLLKKPFLVSVIGVKK